MANFLKKQLIFSCRNFRSLVQNSVGIFGALKCRNFSSLCVGQIRAPPSGSIIPNPQWNCPWLSEAVLLYSIIFLQLFMHFLQVLVLLIIIVILYNTLRHLLVSSARTNVFQNLELDTVPVELPYQNCPWPRGGVLQYPSFLPFSM